ncbi:MAG: hypothetical protein M1819_003985 [Sarea resinae]|nr:MAG: hypothetical protein M1819_003985 [Sarea resinae]
MASFHHAAVSVSKFVGTISLGLMTVSSFPAYSPTPHPFAIIAQGPMHHPPIWPTDSSNTQGITYTHSTTTLPSLLSLPSATPASRALHRLHVLTTRHLTLLSSLSLVSLSLAYTLSPSRARHPYLLWTSLTVLLGSVGDWAASRHMHAVITSSFSGEAGEAGEAKAGREWEEEEVVNGEVVRGEMERGRRVWGARTAISGLAFGMAVVGIWGDGV